MSGIGSKGRIGSKGGGVMASSCIGRMQSLLVTAIPLLAAGCGRSGRNLPMKNARRNPKRGELL